MSKLHPRFELLEPRFLLSSIGLVDGSSALARTGAALSPLAVRPEELPVAGVEDQAEEFLSPADGESLVSPPVVERLLPQEFTGLSESNSRVPRLACATVSSALLDKPAVAPDLQSRDGQTTTIPAVVIEPAVSHDPTSGGGTTLSSGDATFAAGDVAVKESVSAVPDDTTPASNITQTLADDRISSAKPSKKVAVNTSPTLVAITESNAALETSDGARSLNNQAQWSRTESDATAEVVEERKATTTGQGRIDMSATDDADEQEPGKDEALAETDADTAGSELTDAHKAWLAAVQEPDSFEKAASPNAAFDDPDARLREQAVAEADRPAAPQTQATVATSSPTSSPTVSRRISNRTDEGNPFAMAADLVFSEEQRGPGGRWAASQTLPPTEGALLLVVLGKPLTRLAAGDGRVDVATASCGPPATRTAFDRSRRNRRRTAEPWDRWERHGDARDLTWLPPEKPSTDILYETTESAQEQGGDPRSAAEPISSRLADLAVFSHLGVARPEDRSRPPESRLPSSAAWNGYGMLGAAAVTLTGTISVLAIDRHCRIQGQRRRVELPVPAYTGRTLARI